MKLVQPLIGLLCMAALCSQAAAEQVQVAVATNFRDTAQQLAAAFSKGSGHAVVLTSGSTGKLYAQIMHGAPFDLFMAADQARPKMLVGKNMAQRSDRKTYAEGKLAVVAQPGHTVEHLLADRFNALAIANPKLAPYGLAAQQALISLGVLPGSAPKIVFGENVGQAYAMVASGSADFGIVALSLTLQRPGELYVHPIAEDLYQPIRQDAVLLAADKPAARAFFEFLFSPSAQALIAAAGYGVSDHH